MRKTAGVLRKKRRNLIDQMRFTPPDEVLMRCHLVKFITPQGVNLLPPWASPVDILRCVSPLDCLFTKGRGFIPNSMDILQLTINSIRPGKRGLSRCLAFNPLKKENWKK